MAERLLRRPDSSGLLVMTPFFVIPMFSLSFQRRQESRLVPLKRGSQNINNVSGFRLIPCRNDNIQGIP
jgi:hypothetical protein